MSDFLKFLAGWAWKREGRDDKQRFVDPYLYPWTEEDEDDRLTVHQDRSNAKTVWDSSIVLSKYFQKALDDSVNGKSCLELGCGCGLPGLVLGKLGAKVLLTDLKDTLDITQKNIDANSLRSNVEVAELKWGKDVGQVKGSPFDVIIATDTMYIPEEAETLLLTIEGLSSSNTVVYLSYGRNRYAEDEFKEMAVKHNYTIYEIPEEELDDKYQCGDVTVLKLTKGNASAQPSSKKRKTQKGEEKKQAEQKNKGKKEREEEREEEAEEEEEPKRETKKAKKETEKKTPKKVQKKEVEKEKAKSAEKEKVKSIEKTPKKEAKKSPKKEGKKSPAPKEKKK
ncbi:hypothetical protein PROFUN_11835 [Planoprotostelium fungivorum]|uniref:Uncharacterized protein n=1 Tax=Planoprotostelium fungivorum TaxID=1890364 RepID=A0A2P6N999_9EUKA|nr:hypothetical protein PROFUN_11835 [Planoprotostelium fungivorum]